MIGFFLHGPCPGPRRRWPGRALALILALGAWTGVAGTAAGVERLDAQRAEIRALEAELMEIDAAAEAAAGAHAAAAGRVGELREAIRRNGARVAEARRAHRLVQQRLADRLVAIYAQRSPSLVEVLLTTGSLSDAVDAQRALETVSVNDGRMLAQIERSRARLAELRRRLVADRREAEARAAEATTRMRELERLLAGRRAVLAQARATLDALVAEERRRQEEEAARQARARALAAAQARAEERLRARAAAPAAPGSSPAQATPPPSPPPPAPSSGGPGVAVLDRIARCESGGNPRAVSPSGQYRGKYQFDPQTWRSVGGQGDPAAAPEAEQDRRAAILYRQRGAAPWPVCGYS